MYGLYWKNTFILMHKKSINAKSKTRNITERSTGIIPD